MALMILSQYVRDVLPALDEIQTHLKKSDVIEGTEKGPSYSFTISVVVQKHRSPNTHGLHNRNFVNVSTLCKCAYILFIEPNVKQMIYEFNHRYAPFPSQSPCIHIHWQSRA